MFENLFSGIYAYRILPADFILQDKRKKIGRQVSFLCNFTSSKPITTPFTNTSFSLVYKK